MSSPSSSFLATASQVVDASLPSVQIKHLYGGADSPDIGGITASSATLFRHLYNPSKEAQSVKQCAFPLGTGPISTIAGFFYVYNKNENDLHLGFISAPSFVATADNKELLGLQGRSAFTRHTKFNTTTELDCQTTRISQLVTPLSLTRFRVAAVSTTILEAHPLDAFFPDLTTLDIVSAAINTRYVDATDADASGLPVFRSTNTESDDSVGMILPALFPVSYGHNIVFPLDPVPFPSTATDLSFLDSTEHSWILTNPFFHYWINAVKADPRPFVVSSRCRTIQQLQRTTYDALQYMLKTVINDHLLVVVQDPTVTPAILTSWLASPDYLQPPELQRFHQFILPDPEILKGQSSFFSMVNSQPFSSRPPSSAPLASNTGISTLLGSSPSIVLPSSASTPSQPVQQSKPSQVIHNLSILLCRASVYAADVHSAERMFPVPFLSAKRLSREQLITSNSTASGNSFIEPGVYVQLADLKRTFVSRFVNDKKNGQAFITILAATHSERGHQAMGYYTPFRIEQTTKFRDPKLYQQIMEGTFSSVDFNDEASFSAEHFSAASFIMLHPKAPTAAFPANGFSSVHPLVEILLATQAFMITVSSEAEESLLYKGYDYIISTITHFDISRQFNRESFRLPALDVIWYYVHDLFNSIIALTSLSAELPIQCTFLQTSATIMSTALIGQSSLEDCLHNWVRNFDAAMNELKHAATVSRINGLLPGLGPTTRLHSDDWIAPGYTPSVPQQGASPPNKKSKRPVQHTPDHKSDLPKPKKKLVSAPAVFVPKQQGSTVSDTVEALRNLAEAPVFTYTNSSQGKTTQVPYCWSFALGNTCSNPDKTCGWHIDINRAPYDAKLGYKTLRQYVRSETSLLDWSEVGKKNSFLGAYKGRDN